MRGTSLWVLVATIVLVVAGAFGAVVVSHFEQPPRLEPIPTPVAQLDFERASRCVLKLDASTHYGSCVTISCQREGLTWRLVLVTAKHVVDGPPMMLIGPNFEVPAGVLWKHDDRDIALVTAYSPVELPVMPVRFDSPKFGEQLWSIGYGADMQHESGTAKWLTDGRMCDPNLASVQVTFGDSGGAIFDNLGRLVGVITNVGTINNLSPFPQAVHHHCMFAPMGLVSVQLESIWRILPQPK